LEDFWNVAEVAENTSRTGGARVLLTGNYEGITVDMTNDIAEKKDVCGGKMQVIICTGNDLFADEMNS
jgi:hypothetical protein